MSPWLLPEGADLGVALGTIAVGAIAAAACAIVGCYLVLRRMSLMGDAISHAVLPGIALAYLLTGEVGGLTMLVGAIALGLLTTFLTQSVHGFGRVPEDASMGLVFTSLFAIGVLLISEAAPRADLDPGCVLYGLIEFVALDTVPIAGLEVPRTAISLGLVLLGVVLFVTLLWKELRLASFDAGFASAAGYSATLIHYLLMAVVAVVTVASFEAVGSILVVAMLIVPPATAHLLTDRLDRLILLSALLGATSAVLGYLGAVWVDTSVAGMMAVAAGGQLLLAVIFAPRHGLVTRWRHNLSLAVRIASEDVLGTLYRREEDAFAAAASGSGVSRALLGVSVGSEEARRKSRPWVGWWAVHRLVRRGALNCPTPGELSLTDRGRAEATRIVRGHRLWEAYLDEQFELPRDHLHDPAERMEHFLDPDLQDQIETALQQAARDPHGRAIPVPPDGSPAP